MAPKEDSPVPDSPGREDPPGRWRRPAVAARTATLTVALLFLFAVRHELYEHLPPAIQGDFYAGCASVCILFMLFIIRPWLPLMAWIALEEIESGACAFLRIWYPVAFPSDEKCSDYTGFRLGTIGLMLLSIVVYLYVEQITRKRKM